MHERRRRSSRTKRVREFMVARPNELVSANVLSIIGGFCAWRTRISDARKELEAEGRGTIKWNENPRDSRYKFVPVQAAV